MATVLALSRCVSTSCLRRREAGILYNAQSPDEEALCKAARECGFELRSRVGSTVTVRIGGKDTPYEILAVQEFTNSRARMSVVVRLPNGNTTH
jgi:phospholipid-translocating ATPase